ncbi:MAG: ComF family protein [Pseudomonas sp.]
MTLEQVYEWLNNNQSEQCLLCLSRGHSFSHGICAACHRDLPWLQQHCRQCAIPLALEDALCGQCQQHPPAFSQVVVPFTYRFPLDSLIPAFKHHHQLTFGRLLSRLLIDHVTHHYEERQQALPDALVAMPLHPRRQAERGFNQAQELARPMTKALGCPILGDALARTRATPAQQGLSASVRKRSVQDAFACPRPEQVADKHLALIDDVLTTGATADAASRTLLAAGAASVSIWCIARTP